MYRANRGVIKLNTKLSRRIHSMTSALAICWGNEQLVQDHRSLSQRQLTLPLARWRRFLWFVSRISKVLLIDSIEILSLLKSRRKEHTITFVCVSHSRSHCLREIGMLATSNRKVFWTLDPTRNTKRARNQVIWQACQKSKHRYWFF